MTINPLYKYSRVDGGITVSPYKPSCEYKEMYRAIADDGKAFLIEGAFIQVIDTENTDDLVEETLPLKEDREERKDADMAGFEPENVSYVMRSGDLETNDVPISVTLTGIDYLEWLDYKSRLSNLEYAMELISNFVRDKQ